MSNLIRGAVVLSFVLAAPSAVNAKSLCQTRSDTIKIRAACLKRETVVSLPTLGVPIVTDAHGVEVGKYVDVSGTQYAVRQVGDIGVRFYVDTDGIVGGTPVFIHAVADCSDPPLLNAGDFGSEGLPGAPRTFPIAFVQDTTIYYPVGPKAMVHNPPAISYVGVNESTCTSYGGALTTDDRCCVPQNYCPGCGYDTPTSPYATANLDAAFTPPLRVEGYISTSN